VEKIYSLPDQPLLPQSMSRLQMTLTTLKVMTPGTWAGSTESMIEEVLQSD